MRHLRAVLCLGVILVIPSVARAATIHVPSEAPTIQAGIDAAAPGDTVLISCGTYTWSGEGSGNPSGLIHLKSSIVLTSETTDPACVIVDAEGQGAVLELRRLHDVEIVGLTIRGGVGATGGGAWLLDSSVRFRACVFASNQAASGGGLAATGGTLELVGCDFRDNLALSGAGGGASVDATATVAGCRFEGNTAFQGGAFWGTGYATGGSLLITGCDFIGNRAGGGGALLLYEYASARVADCLFVDNRGEAGAAILSSATPCQISSSTFFANTGDGQAVFCDLGATTIDRCIIGFGVGAPVSCSPGTTAVLSCCDVYSPTGIEWSGCLYGQEGVRGNFSQDPLFCAAGAGEFTLHATSPCLPGLHPGGQDCELIGARGVGCSPTAVRPVSWGRLKTRR